MTPWREQFERSLLDYVLANKDKTSLLAIGSVDEYIDSYLVGPVRDLESPKAALRALAAFGFQRAYREFEEAMERTESPIEIAMLLALMLAGRDRLRGSGDVYFSARGRPAESDDYKFFSIEPQAQLGKARVDFLVTLSSLEPVDLTSSRRLGIRAPDHIKRLAGPHGYVDLRGRRRYPETGTYETGIPCGMWRSGLRRSGCKTIWQKLSAAQKNPSARSCRLRSRCWTPMASDWSRPVAAM